MTAKPKQPTLPAFETNAVAKAQVRITRAGDGLSAALEVQPKALFLGDEVFYVLRGRVTQVNHREKEEDGPVIRMHTVEATGITEVDAELAEKLLQAAAEETARMRAEIDGQLRLEDERAAEAREAND
jgi:hypothetical protein